MRKLSKNRKAYSFVDITWIAITLGVGIIVLSIVAQIVGEIKSTQCDGSLERMYGGVCYACPNSTHSNFLGGETGGSLCVNMTIPTDGTNYENASNVSASIGGDWDVNISGQGQEGIWKLANWLPTIGLVLGAVIVITALAVLFTMKFGKT